ncbi:hypothetical protein GG804_27045 [Sphingomonas histidinilytica]|uniref:hypothetical protein n=1 Tax=Rhizorhabdus histidinilytica TaxID=439228 RepID=UPI001ADB0C32|nr:hypothetical protein [Rhizorhabdus histidinilytica]MBO9380425.1 hypothetical protein [Rhizorhabdus histidinilytica]
MSTPDPNAYKLLKCELRRLDPTNGILAFVEEIEADMVASAVPSDARLRMPALTDIELVEGAHLGFPGYAEEARARGIDPGHWGRREQPPFTPEQEARLREIVRDAVLISIVIGNEDSMKISAMAYDALVADIGPPGTGYDPVSLYHAVSSAKRAPRDACNAAEARGIDQAKAEGWY